MHLLVACRSLSPSFLLSLPSSSTSTVLASSLHLERVSMVCSSNSSPRNHHFLSHSSPPVHRICWQAKQRVRRVTLPTFPVSLSLSRSHRRFVSSGPFFPSLRGTRPCRKGQTEVSVKRERPLTNGFNAFLPHRRILYETVSARAPLGYVAPSIWHVLFTRTIHRGPSCYRDVNSYEIPSVSISRPELLIWDSLKNYSALRFLSRMR